MTLRGFGRSALSHGTTLRHASASRTNKIRSVATLTPGLRLAFTFAPLNNNLSTLLTPDAVTHALQKFWGEQLRVVQSRDRLTLALPLMNPDGWQVVVSLQPLSATRAVISDRGETLARLDNAGLDLDAEGTERLLRERLTTFELIADGNELKKEIALPIDGIDIQLFGEALVSIAHLVYRHEPSRLRAE